MTHSTDCSVLIALNSSCLLRKSKCHFNNLLLLQSLKSGYDYCKDCCSNNYLYLDNCGTVREVTDWIDVQNKRISVGGGFRVSFGCCSLKQYPWIWICWCMFGWDWLMNGFWHWFGLNWLLSWCWSFVKKKQLIKDKRLKTKTNKKMNKVHGQWKEILETDISTTSCASYARIQRLAFLDPFWVFRLAIPTDSKLNMMLVFQNLLNINI